MKTEKKNVYDCSIIELPKHDSQRRGNLSVVANGKTLPFDVKRFFYLYDVPAGEGRGAHAHRTNWQYIVAASGSFSVTLDDGLVKRTIMLNRPYMGLLVVPGIWCTLRDFSSGAVALVLTSHNYDESDYIRDFNKFIEFRKDE